MHRRTMTEDIVKLMIENDADVYAENDDPSGRFPVSALHYAALAGNKGLMDLLWERNAEINCNPMGRDILYHVLITISENRTPDGVIAAHLLVQKGATVGTKHLVAAVAKISQLWKFCAGNTSISLINTICNNLKAQGSDVNGIHVRRTALHFAQYWNCQDIITLLCNHGARSIFISSFGVPERRGFGSRRQAPEDWENVFAQMEELGRTGSRVQGESDRTADHSEID